jgi:heme/copper-type cytochrome/quinol oxidase subunit 1
VPPDPPRRSVLTEEGVTGDYFQKPPALIQFLDQTEEAIRSRLSRLKLFDRVFLLQRDWMTRITMLMVIFSLLWGAVGGFDIFGFQSQVVGWTQLSTIHLSNEEIYSAVTLHGIRMLFGFTQQLEMAIFGLLLVNALSLTPRHKWRLYTSVGLINLSILLFQGPVYLFPFNDNYFPAIGWYFLNPLGVNGVSLYVVSPLWYLGWFALCASVFLWCWWMVSHLRTWWQTRATRVAGERLPVFLLFLIITIVLIVVSYLPLVVSTVWDVGSAYLGWPVDALANQVIFWLFGHGIVYVLFLLPVTGLYLLIPILARRPVYSYRWAVVAAILFVVLTPTLGIHHLYLTPLPSWAVWLTMVLSFAIIVPSAITFFSLWMTLKGVPASQWEWNAVSLFTLLSFGGSIAGGLSGPVLATVPWNADLHNSLFVLSHFHAITILSIVTGAYALLYAFFPILTGRSWFSASLARLHFLFTAVGGVGVVLAMDQLGSLGLLRRSFIIPELPAVTYGNLFLYAAMIVILVGQLFFLLNGFLTVFRGTLFSAPGLSFDEAVRKAAQSTAFRRARKPFHDLPFVRKVPHARRDRTEKIWVGVLSSLLVIVLLVYTPSAFSTSNAIGTPGHYPTGTEFISADGRQYYWAVQETGAVNGTYDNVFVAYAGQWVNINATAQGATQELYLPFRSQPVVAAQVVPGATSYALFQAPTTPGVYGMPDGEYDGPWFGQDVSALIVLPDPGNVPSLAAFQADGGAGDLYDPPVLSAARASLVGNGEGVFNFSVPGPTLTASAGPVEVRWTIPLSSIGISNYLVNVTSTNPSQQQQYVIDHNYTLPFRFGLWEVNASRGPLLVTDGPLEINAPETTRASLGPGVYLYGVTQPISYSYNPSGESGGSTGTQRGYVMGLWGVLWVSG